MTKIALITGATSGIGWATAVELAEKGYRIIATGRRAERLEALQQQLSVPVYPLVFDVRDKEAVQEAIDSLPEAWRQVEVLVNNAGNAHGLAPIQEGALDDWDAMIDINVKGLLYVTKAVLPLMLPQKKGHIVNIGSIAGKEVYPNGNVYCGSKHAVDALSKGMRIDLVQEGIRVSEVNPGLVETEFSEVRFKGDKVRAASVYQGFEALQAQDIAELISFIVTRPAHVNLAEVLVLPTAQASATVLHKQ
ncbi:NADP-dependent 3-hydroxy acid dehydrogenase YdfG [Pontibacter ummariensis]|uniref:NADP-dependent 3-hydroxy acid dehydrogenase YdfG n=1 Tax=Pontibacter ummariensis TaxID=1610492 RepID=A0A239EBD8_9BACT|nr:SDR family NAD(P)-dependent oxidoreductase [Pontibacter ummariensis]PRY13173.1 NADP-dependent 3-hydroxy acid dehydrogenase YdfG [Pontibacter ummariensis]SNS41907.1 NADP-dependent 3-hydroxy acid dehydrogenase YdfG [Pontibacter ummariensis]